MSESAICNSVSDCAKLLGSVCNRIDLRWNVIVFFESSSDTYIQVQGWWH